MTDAKYDVLGIGNAIFDVLVQTDEGFLARHGMTKGGMTLVDEARAATIYEEWARRRDHRRLRRQHHRRPRLVRRAAAFIGKVKADQVGTSTPTTSARRRAFDPGRRRRARRPRCSYILVTPDGERTMNTYLGAAQDLSPADVDASAVAAAAIVYLEGYLWDPPRQGSLPQGRRRSRTTPVARWR